MAALPHITRQRHFALVKKHGVNHVTPAFVALCLIPPPYPVPYAHYAVIASRKVGGAVQRNRAKRRLRALLHHHRAPTKRYALILIARKTCLTHPFHHMQRDFKRALSTLLDTPHRHKTSRQHPRQRHRARPIGQKQAKTDSQP